MHDRERIKRWTEKEDLIDEVKAAFGIEPPGLRQILAALAHPDVVEHTQAYFRALDKKHLCEHYDEPWSCAREAEAKYETIKYGWLGAGAGVGFDESWCEPCRQRVLAGTLD